MGVMISGPDLTGRIAYCTYFNYTPPRRPSLNYGPIYGGGECARDGEGCRCAVPSNTDLPFFEYHGLGSRRATELCVCGYYASAHGKPHIKCADFRAQGDSPDAFYCGCAGWE